MLADPYFQQEPPKSTGKEYFNLDWLTPHINGTSPQDVQATLVELTAINIASQAQIFSTSEIIICGGGAHNDYLLQRITKHLPECAVTTSQTYDIDPDWIEAMAFAWLAKQSLERRSIPLEKITGAKCNTILGGIYYPPGHAD